MALPLGFAGIIAGLKEALSVGSLAKEFVTDTALDKITGRGGQKTKQELPVDVSGAVGKYTPERPSEDPVNISVNPIQVDAADLSRYKDTPQFAHYIKEQTEGIDKLNDYVKQRDLKQERKEKEYELEKKSTMSGAAAGAGVGAVMGDGGGIASGILSILAMLGGPALWTAALKLNEFLEKSEAVREVLDTILGTAIEYSDEAAMGYIGARVSKRIGMKFPEMKMPGSKMDFSKVFGKNVPYNDPFAGGGRTADSKKYAGLFEYFNKKYNQIFTKTADLLKSVSLGTIKFFGFTVPKVILSPFIASGKYIMKRLPALYAILELGKLMWRTSGLDTSNEAAMKEWHKGNKEQLNNIITGLGAPVLFGFIGSFFMPGIGSILGLIFGAFFGEDIYKSLHINEITDALYDTLFMDDYQAGKRLWDKFKDYAKTAMLKELGQFVGDALKSGVKKLESILSPAPVLNTTSGPTEFSGMEEYTGSDIGNITTVTAVRASEDSVDAIAKPMIRKHEGVKYRPYKDSEGKWTVGIGHLIGDGSELPESMNRTFTEEEVETMFEEDYQKHKEAAKKIPNYDKLDIKGKAALVDLTFNMGAGWHKKFPNFTEAIKRGDMQSAAAELVDSQWYHQVASRSREIVPMIAGSKIETTPTVAVIVQQPSPESPPARPVSPTATATKSMDVATTSPSVSSDYFWA